MDKAAVYHRPDSEYAYLVACDTLQIRLRLAKDDAKKVELIAGDPYLLAEDRWCLNPTLMEKSLSTLDFDYCLINVQAEFRRLSYAFKVTDFSDEIYFYTDLGFLPWKNYYFESADVYFRMPYFQDVDRFVAPEWVSKTVWYQIFPERFANGNSANDPEGVLAWGSKEHPGRLDFYGGDLQGVLEHLSHFTDLGINGLYFCPIFQASSNHKYDTLDYFEVDSNFGDKNLFKKLVDECHKRGIKVMLDAVFNHVSGRSPFWQDVLQNQEKSAYASWFQIRDFPPNFTPTASPEVAENLTYDVFARNPAMPKLNTANIEVQKYLLKVAIYWIREFDIDAWRLDVASEIDHHFWKKFHQECLKLKNNFYILGEIWHSARSFLVGDEFQAVMNYPLREIIIDYFLKQKIQLSKMISLLNEQLMNYRDG